MARATLTMVLNRAGDSTEGPLLSRGCEIGLARCRHLDFSQFVCVCYTGFRHSRRVEIVGEGAREALAQRAVLGLVGVVGLMVVAGEAEGQAALARVERAEVVYM